MATLLETYCCSTGLIADKKAITSDLVEDFYPLTVDKYITIQSSSVNQDAKNYNYWDLVVKLIKPELDKSNISIVHIGAKDDTPVQYTIDLRGKTSFHQGNYIIKRSLLHLGVDSCWMHIAGANNIPIVELFGGTDVGPHKPFWFNKDKTKFLVSHRNDKRPTFSNVEDPKTINFIKPEEVARGVLEILSLPQNINHSTVYIGQNYGPILLELIPDMVPSAHFNPGVMMTVRMDKYFNEENLAKLVSTGRQVNIVTNKPLSRQLLDYLMGYGECILSYNHEIDIMCGRDYADYVKKTMKDALFFTRSTNEKYVADLRLKFLDSVQIQLAETNGYDNFKKATNKYCNNSVDFKDKIANLSFSTNKYILSNSQSYLSHAHLSAKIPFSDCTGKQVNGESDGFMQVIDTDEFWDDMLYYNVRLNN